MLFDQKIFLEFRKVEIISTNISFECQPMNELSMNFESLNFAQWQNDPRQNSTLSNLDGWKNANRTNKIQMKIH